MKKLIALLCAALISGVSLVPAGVSAASADPMVSPFEETVGISAADTNGFTAEVVKLVNQERSRRGLRELKMFPKLNYAANIRAKETAVKWDHVRPDGRAASTVCDDLGIRYGHLGENIAYGQNTPASVMNSWMNSEAHRNNILSSDYQYIGVGVAVSGGRVYWTQYFIGTSENHPEAYSAKDYGDVNGDGRLDAIDASRVLAEYASVMSGRSYTLSTSQRAKADVSGDNVVDAVDASQILNIYAKNSVN